MDAAGPISRTVTDCAATLGAIAGYDPNDPYTRNAPVPDYLDGLDSGVRGLRVGVISDRVNAEGVEPGVSDAVNAAVAHMGELGAEVEEVSIPLIADSAVISTTLIYVDATGVHRQGLRDYPEKYDHNNRVRLLTGALVPALAHQKAARLRQMLRNQVLDALNRVDVLGPASVVGTGDAHPHRGPDCPRMARKTS